MCPASYSLLAAAASLVLVVAHAQRTGGLRREHRDGSNFVNDPFPQRRQRQFPEELFRHIREQDLLARQRRDAEPTEAPVVTHTVPVTATVTQTLQRQQRGLRGWNAQDEQQGTVVISNCVTKIEHPSPVVVTMTSSALPQTVYLQGGNLHTVTVTVTKVKGHGTPEVGTQKPAGYTFTEPDVKFSHGRGRRDLEYGDSFLLGDDDAFSRRHKLTGFFPDRRVTALPNYYSVVSEFHEPEGSGEL